MNLIMLSGESLRNRDWIAEAHDEMASLVDQTYVQQYRHWELDQPQIDLDHELSELAVAAEEFGGAGDYGIFAKSIGTVLTVKALDQGIVRPKFLLLMGAPLGYIIPNYPEYATNLAAAQLPTTMIHNAHDKVGTAHDVNEYLNTALTDKSNFTFIVTPGDTHDYLDYDLLRGELQKLIS